MQLTPAALLWRLVASTSAPPVPPGTTPVLVATSPLIGAPPFLRLHVKVRYGQTVLDFVPREPTAPATLRTLLSGRPVDGVIRAMPARGDGDSWRTVGHAALAEQELEEYACGLPPELSLLGNNCWTFASSVVGYAEAGVDMGGDSSRGT